MTDAEHVLIPGWSFRLRMLSSGRLWTSFVLVFGIPVTVLGVIVAFTSGIDDAVVVCGAGWSVFAFLWAMVGAIIDVSGGFTSAYVVTNLGVHVRMGQGARGAADGTALIGIVSGSTAAMGAGLLARAEQGAFLAWENVRKVTVRERSRYIQLRAGFGTKPIGINCTTENFTSVRDVVRAHCPV